MAAARSGLRMRSPDESAPGAEGCPPIVTCRGVHAVAAVGCRWWRTPIGAIHLHSIDVKRARADEIGTVSAFQRVGRDGFVAGDARPEFGRIEIRRGRQREADRIGTASGAGAVAHAVRATVGADVSARAAVVCVGVGVHFAAVG